VPARAGPIRSIAPGGGSVEISSAKQLLDCGTISTAGFEQLKSSALAERTAPSVA
jgi:hypothetical protein